MPKTPDHHPVAEILTFLIGMFALAALLILLIHIFSGMFGS